MQRALAIQTDSDAFGKATASSRYPNTTAGKLAYQLGWCSIALGVIELLASRRVARTLGMRGQEQLIRAYGVREVVKGVGLLTSLDLGTLANAYRTSPKRRNLAIAMANVAGSAAVDVLAAQQLGAVARRHRQPTVDYSTRSGFPRGVEASRGLAANAEIPADFRTPSALRPLT
jgi:hypothetical protein